MTDNNDEPSSLAASYESIREQMGQFIVGNERLIELSMIALLSGGHLLIEGTPGTGKTSIVKAVARLAGCNFSRFQCAVDSQPADIIGIRIFDPHLREFSLRKGPIFTNFLLIDEINRLSPKTQGAFIEAMSERQATIDGITIPIEPPFIVIATQNPFEFEGTFPLIEAEKDRFMFSMSVSQLDEAGELQIIRREQEGKLDWDSYYSMLRPITNKDLLINYRNTVNQIYINDHLLDYIKDIIIATRTHGDIHIGASSRASIALVRGSKALAALQHRTFVLPDDIKWLAPKTLQHRIILGKEAEMSDITVSGVISDILDSIEVP